MRLQYKTCAVFAVLAVSAAAEVLANAEVLTSFGPVGHLLCGICCILNAWVMSWRRSCLYWGVKWHVNLLVRQRQHQPKGSASTVKTHTSISRQSSLPKSFVLRVRRLVIKRTSTANKHRYVKYLHSVYE